MKKHILETALLVAVLVVWTTLLPGGSLAQQAQLPQFLFVQNAKGVVFEKGTITLKGVSPATLFFSDRPMRMAGHFTTEEFVRKVWGEGKDSFASSPPNATLSIFQEDRDDLIDVVIKLSRPKLEGDDLTYNVAILEGQIPAKGGICSVFIDIIGLPFTPLSFAGVARRTAYRTAVWGSAAAATTAAAYHPPTVIVTEPPAPPSAPAVPPPPPAAAGKPLPLGTVVSTLPPGCISTPVGGVDYFYCGGNFYRAVVQENKLEYVTALPQ
jgi:hypothetical protein